MRRVESRIVCTAFVVSLTWAGIARAQGNEFNLSDEPQASNALLDEMRGGFDAGGLQISFGIEREGYVNGKLISAIRFNIGDVAMPHNMTNAAPIQSTDAGKLAPPATALVIQNTLNLQHIRSLTVINATANSLELVKSLNLHATLADALAQSLRSR